MAPGCLLLLLLLLQVKYAQDQDFFYAQFALLFSRLAHMGHRNIDIMTVPCGGSSAPARARSGASLLISKTRKIGIMTVPGTAGA
jgi:hypothetical protein